jgi:hypothetical protein
VSPQPAEPLPARIERELATPLEEALLDPLAAARLEQLTEELAGADGTPALLAALVGRRARLAEPASTEARRLADQAVGHARAAGPDMLVAALGIRAQSGWSGQDASRAGEDAREMIAVGQQAGRMDWVVQGYARWADAALTHGRLRTAIGAVDRMTTLAILLDSPEPSRAAAVRRVGVLAYRGDYDAARAQVDELAGTSAEVPERDLRLGLALLFGRSLTARDRELFTGVPDSPRAQLQAALLGDDFAAEYWLGHVAAAPQGPGALDNLALLARVAVARSDRAAAGELIPRLQRYAGLVPTLELPVDWHLTRLSLLRRDSEAALGHAERTLDLARRMPSGLLEAWAHRMLSRVQGRSEAYAEAAVSRDLAASAAAGAGVLLPDDLPEGSEGAEAGLRRIGADWLVTSPLGGGVVPGLVGMGHLARLLATAEPISAAELDGVLPVPRSGRALGPGVRAGYRDRFAALWQGGEPEVAEADLLAEVRTAAGLERQEFPGAVLVPQRVGHSLRRAIEAISAVAPDLGAHLRVSVRTRAWCRYDPPPDVALVWRVDLG